MPIIDKISRTAELAKWKIKQQKEIFDIQGEISDINSKINQNKISLSEKAFTLYKKSSLSEDSLIEVCKNIEELIAIKNKLNEDLEFIRSQNPQIREEQENKSTQQPNSEIYAVCPKCGKPVPIRFCPNCGFDCDSLK